MNEKIYFLSVDLGTESVRAGLLDTKGTIIHAAVQEYRTYYPKNGWAEQDPYEWWEAFLQVMRKVSHDSGVPKEQIRAVVFDTTCSTVAFMDTHFEPLRNALIWMDVRSSRQAEMVAASRSSVLKYTGFGSVSAGWMVPKVLWVKEHEPEIYARAAFICEFQDWINFKVTGKFVGSVNSATIRGFYDRRGGGWPVDLYEKTGIPDLVEKLPKEMLFMGDPVGQVRPEVADACGLSRKTLVIQGGCDACHGQLGLGVYRPGEVCMITGSSHVLFGVAGKEFHDRKVWGTYPDFMRPGDIVVEGSQISTGSVLNWFRERFVKQNHLDEAKRRNQKLLDYLNTLAEGIKPGSDGLVLLEYWQGNRNPFSDSRARGVIWGLSLNHTEIHVYRAILEGVAYGVAHIIQAFQDCGFEPKEIRACGGATRSALWMQITSDVTGLPILLPGEPDAPLVGGGVLCAFGRGVYASIEEAIGNMVTIKSVVKPNSERYRAYRYFVEKHRETYWCMKDLMHDMTRHEES
jgi:FGGY-family pentulose kinase